MLEQKVLKALVTKRIKRRKSSMSIYPIAKFVPFVKLINT